MEDRKEPAELIFKNQAPVLWSSYNKVYSALELIGIYMGAFYLYRLPHFYFTRSRVDG